MTLIDNTLKQFVDITASEAPVPGGGSISALCGSLSAALAKMVAGLTIGKKKYAAVQDEMIAAAAALSAVPDRILALVDKDSDAYDVVFQAYKLPKETDEEKAARTAQIQQALRHAALVPLSVARIVDEAVLPQILLVAEKGNTNAITDAYVASLCARAAMLGACANVRINLLSITDADFTDKVMLDVVELETKALGIDEAVRIIMMESM